MHKDSILSKKGISDKKARKEFFKAYPIIHFSIPIHRQLESEDDRSKNDPLLQGFQQLTREKDDSSGITWHRDSAVVCKEFCIETWEKANFMAWLIRERKYQDRLEKDRNENNGGFLEQTALASKFCTKLFDGFPNRTADEFRECTKLPNKAIQPNISGKSGKSGEAGKTKTPTKSASQLKVMFDNMLDDFWNAIENNFKRNDCDKDRLATIPEQPNSKEPDLTSDTRRVQPSARRKSPAAGVKKRSPVTSEPSQTPLPHLEISTERKAPKKPQSKPQRKPGKTGTQAQKRT
jgi:hypothetical protein